MEVTYRTQNGFRLPNLLLPQKPETHLGKYAELRHRRVLYTNLRTTCQLTPDEVKELDAHFKIGLTYSSNALECNSLTLSETNVLLEKNPPER